MALYQVGEGQYEVPDNVQGAELQGVLEGLAAQESGQDQETKVPASQFLAENLPEIGESKELNDLSKSGFLSSLAALSITDPEELGQALSKQVPGSFVSRDQSGNALINFPSGTFAINKPGVSGQDFAQFGFRAAAFTPAGRVSGSLGKRVAQAGAKSAATEAGLQAGEAGLGGEFDSGQPLMAGVFGAGAEPILAGLSPAVKALVQPIRRLKARRFADKQGIERGGVEQSLRQAEIAQEATSETGVALTKAQQTADPFQLQEQSFVAQLPEGSKRGLEFLGKQNKEAGQAVEDFLNALAPPSAVVVGPRNIRTAANKAIELKALARREKTSPLYNQAFSDFREQGAALNIKPVLDEIDIRLQQYPENHAAARALKTFSKNISSNSGDLQKLHGVKEIVDTKIANLSSGKPTSATNKAAMEAIEVQHTLVGLMEDASPQYRAARLAYIDESGPINSLRDSIVGIIADSSDDQLKNVSKKLLDPSQTNPEVVRQARRALRKVPGGDDAWNQIVRNEMERRLGSAKSELNQVISGDVGSIQNVPAILLTSLGLNQVKSRRALMAALTPIQKRNLEFIETSLKRSALGRNIGSPTALREEIKNRIDKGVVSAVRRFMKGPLTSVVEIGEEGARAARINTLSSAVFDEAWSPEIAKIRALQEMGRGKAVEGKFFELLNKVERASVSRGVLQSLRSEE